MSPATGGLTAPTRTVFIGSAPGELTGLEAWPTAQDRLLMVVGAAVDGPEVDWPAVADHTGEVLGKIHACLKGFVAPEGELCSGQRVVVLADEAAVLGDPVRPGESAVAGAVVALVRTLAMELRRRGSCINLVLGNTIERPGAPEGTSIADVLSAVDALLCCGPDTTGEEVHLAAGSHLGRVRP